MALTAEAQSCLAVQYKVHGVPRPTRAHGLLDAIAGQLPSATGLDAFVARQARDTKQFRKSKAAFAARSLVFNGQADATAYERSPLAGVTDALPAKGGAAQAASKSPTIGALPDSAARTPPRPTPNGTSAPRDKHVGMPGDLASPRPQRASAAIHGGRPARARKAAPGQRFAAGLHALHRATERSPEERAEVVAAVLEKHVNKNFNLNTLQMSDLVAALQKCQQDMQVRALPASPAVLLDRRVPSHRQHNVQIRAAGTLVQLGLYFSAIRILDSSAALLRPVLHEIRAVVLLNMKEVDDNVAVQTWVWDDVDRTMFTMHFQHLPVIRQYLTACRSLKDLGLHGVFNLLKIERELLFKVPPLGARSVFTMPLSSPGWCLRLRLRDASLPQCSRHAAFKTCYHVG